jgi:hypothetical protein
VPWTVGKLDASDDSGVQRHLSINAICFSSSKGDSPSKSQTDFQKGDHAMNSTAQYLHFGFILISPANLIVIALLIVVFALAVALRLPEKQHLSTLAAVARPEEVGDGELAKSEVRE